MTRVNFFFPVELLRQLARVSERTDTPQAVHLRIGLKTHLDREEQKAEAERAKKEKPL